MVVPLLDEGSLASLRRTSYALVHPPNLSRPVPLVRYSIDAWIQAGPVTESRGYPRWSLCLTEARKDSLDGHPDDVVGTDVCSGDASHTDPRPSRSVEDGGRWQ